MKASLLFLLLVGIVLPVFAEEIEVKHENDVNEEEEEEEEEGEWDIEHEVFGPQVERFKGIHILDENMNVIISEPSERVLRAITGPKKEEELTLEKVKQLYREKFEREERKEDEHHNVELFNQNFQELLDGEQRAADDDARHDSIINRVMDFLW